MTRHMLADLGRLWDEERDDTCRCIILTGGHGRFLCSSDAIRLVLSSEFKLRSGAGDRGSAEAGEGYRRAIGKHPWNIGHSGEPV
jgi:enoyl-CoA hydratase/carnithine racemase